MTEPIDLKQQSGIVLLEALLAILIFSIGVLAVAGLQASMVKNTTDSKFVADANYIAQQRVGAMWADPGNLAAYVEADTNISAVLPGGTRSVALVAGNTYQITVSWQQPGQPRRTYTTIATIVGGA